MGRSPPTNTNGRFVTRLSLRHINVKRIGPNKQGTSGYLIKNNGKKSESESHSSQPSLPRTDILCARPSWLSLIARLTLTSQARSCRRPTLEHLPSVPKSICQPSQSATLSRLTEAVAIWIGFYFEILMLNNFLFFQLELHSCPLLCCE